MFRATCGKKGKVDFWVMRACEAITRVVEEAGYWSLRDTRDKTGEGRKKQRKLVVVELAQRENAKREKLYGCKIFTRFVIATYKLGGCKTTVRASPSWER